MTAATLTEATANLTRRVTLSNVGTAAFPIWTVWAEYDDSEGFCQDHLSHALFRSPSKADAEAYMDFVNG